MTTLQPTLLSVPHTQRRIGWTDYIFSRSILLRPLNQAKRIRGNGQRKW